MGQDMCIRSIVAAGIILVTVGLRVANAAVIYASGGDSSPFNRASVLRFDTVANTGARVPARAEVFKGIDVGPDGFLYVARADIDGNGVLRVHPTSGAQTLFADTGPLGTTDEPGDIAFGPDQNLYVVRGNSVQKYNGTTGASLGAFISGETARNLVFEDGRLYLSHGQTVRRYSATTGAFIDTFVASGSGLADGWGVGFGPDGNLYVADRIGDSVLRFNGQTGAFMDTFVAAGAGGLDSPFDLVFADDGLYIADFEGVLRYDASTGAFLGKLDPTNTADLAAESEKEEA